MEFFIYRGGVLYLLKSKDKQRFCSFLMFLTASVLILGRRLGVGGYIESVRSPPGEWAVLPIGMSAMFFILWPRTYSHANGYFA